MKTSENILPAQFGDVSRAIFAIVHANIHETGWQQHSAIQIPVFRKGAFSDKGVSCELEQGKVTIKVFVQAMLGEQSVYHSAMELQRCIAEEIILYTSLLPRKIDVIVTGVKAKKTQ